MKLPSEDLDASGGFTGTIPILFLLSPTPTISSQDSKCIWELEGFISDQETPEGKSIKSICSSCDRCSNLRDSCFPQLQDKVCELLRTGDNLEAE